ncbi:DUF4365 domain-containing protein [Providencia rettgeri]|uniref:DUF4365 domain-containing protein n=1 Tax=Providencia TaxID=586 RepID=UPI001F03ECA8|nr:DUF4365 domain-containing protein [Providencia rettgeri]MCG9952174.1 DUF4365 domain-containing protein [Providencia rettgeri]MDH2394981.1 DUF4365 domain-containing protein [Providencia rettgeri]
MKKFKSTGVTGAAGELYFAYWIVRNFSWPCRLLDIDVGIDAQVEVFERNISTGDFFAIQVKSTVTSTPDIQIDLTDFKYWRQLDNNVILASVVFSEEYGDPIIYWKYFSNVNLDKIILQIEDKNTSSKLITFDESDILNINSKDKWLCSLISDLDRELIEAADSLLDVIKNISLDEYSGDEDDEKLREHDAISAHSLIYHINSIFLHYEQLKTAIMHDSRLVFKSTSINESINTVEKNEAKLLLIFNYMFDGVKSESMPRDVLPDPLSKAIEQETKEWASRFSSRYL